MRLYLIWTGRDSGWTIYDNHKWKFTALLKEWRIRLDRASADNLEQGGMRWEVRRLSAYDADHDQPEWVDLSEDDDSRDCGHGPVGWNDMIQLQWHGDSATAIYKGRTYKHTTLRGFHVSGAIVEFTWTELELHLDGDGGCGPDLEVTDMDSSHGNNPRWIRVRYPHASFTIQIV